MRSGSGGDDGGDRVQYVPIDIPLGLNRMGEEDPSVDILKHSSTNELTIFPLTGRVRRVKYRVLERDDSVRIVGWLPDLQHLRSQHNTEQNPRIADTHN